MISTASGTAADIGLPAAHPQRDELLGEAHARPVVALQAAQHLTHLALCVTPEEHEREIAHLAALCRAQGVVAPAFRAGQAFIETPTFRLHWEQHTEFSGYTIFANATNAAPFATNGLAVIPADWLARVPGQLLAACHLSLVRGGNLAARPESLCTYFDPQSLSGSRCAGGAATLWTDFKPQADGFTRFLILDAGLPPAQAGRLVQRLLEIETYRLMALLAFPIAKRLMPEIQALENRLSTLTESLAGTHNAVQEESLLESLSSLSARVEQLIAQHNFRLDAAAAYSTLVWRRIDALRETRIEGISMVREFMSRRLAPAMDTCQAIGGRLERLSGRVSRTVSLQRSRVDLVLEEQNRDLLASMNRRTHLQLRLQGTVEGLSVVILSYYTVSLIHYALRGLVATGWQLPVDLLTALSIVVVLPAITGGIYAIHRRIERAESTPPELPATRWRAGDAPQRGARDDGR